jgi:hypothetical protein
MRPDEVRRAEMPGEGSRAPVGPKRASSGESFSALLGPQAPAPAQGPDPPCAPAVVATPLAAPPTGGTPNPFAALAARVSHPRGSAPTRYARPDPLDPATRHSAQIAPLLGVSESSRVQLPPDAPVQAFTRASLEEVLPALVRRIAWSGDGRKGMLRLEFGQGALAGGTLLVQADDGRVRVELQAPPGTDTSVWRGRIASRLTTRGVKLDEIIVE